jgi:drug/metabolite transporter (DMT)-like permease
MTGSLLTALLMFAATWPLAASELPSHISVRAAGSIVYLGVVGSVVGSILFFLALKNIYATQAALITLVTPGCALVLDNLFNNESLTLEIISGAALVLVGLLLFQFADALITARAVFPREQKSSVKDAV